MLLDHEHHAEEATEKLPEAAEAGKVPLEPGVKTYEQSAAACEMLNVWLPTEIDPLRAGPLFASTVNVIVPLPVPDPVG